MERCYLLLMKGVSTHSPNHLATHATTHTYTNTLINTCTHSHTHTHMHAHTHTHTHTHAHTLYRLSYDITVELGIAGTNVCTTGKYDLKNPIIRYVTNPVPASVPSVDHTNPTESYFDSNEIQDMPEEDTALGGVVPTNIVSVPSFNIPTGMRSSMPNVGQRGM